MSMFLWFKRSVQWLLVPALMSAATDAADHWAFIPPQKSPLGDGPAHPIDGLLAEPQGARGVKPQPKAEHMILVRRLFLDLIGLPPTRAELVSDEPFEVLADRLLASPAHAERWARHFMDLWRYSDWYGLGDQLRYSQRHIWHWRDWIIDSIIEDKGYDRMVREMLAGDELAPDDAQVVRATGFLARNYYLFNRNTWLDSTIEHTSKAFLGLTLDCARCHDHKFDPISQDDYFRFRAFFEPHQIRLDSVPGEADLEKDGIPRAFDAHPEAVTHLFIRGDDKSPDLTRTLPCGVPTALGLPAPTPVRVPLPRDAWAPNLRPFVEADLLTQVERDRNARRLDASRAVSQMQKLPLGQRATGAEALLKAVNELVALDRKPAEIRAAIAAEKEGRASIGFPLSSRKALESPVEKPESLASQFPKQSTGRRLALARWITDPANPLTARVIVNHVWLRHFGAPLVPSVFDFGLRCPTPPNQRLLDWLAADFVEHGWSLRHLHRLIVTSAAYQRTSSALNADTATIAADPDNLLYWRFPGRRMEAEVVRDSVLALAGELDLSKVGGQSIASTDTAAKRRSLYFRVNQEDEHKFLMTFDRASVLECYRREESIVPQQALALTNSALVLESAPKIADRLARQDGEFLDEAFLLIFGRHAEPPETSAAASAIAEWNKLNPSQARARLIATLLNHHEFISIR